MCIEGFCYVKKRKKTAKFSGFTTDIYMSRFGKYLSKHLPVQSQQKEL